MAAKNRWQAKHKSPRRTQSHLSVAATYREWLKNRASEENRNTFCRLSLIVSRVDFTQRRGTSQPYIPARVVMLQIVQCSNDRLDRAVPCGRASTRLNHGSRRQFTNRRGGYHRIARRLFQRTNQQIHCFHPHSRIRVVLE